MGRFRSGTPEYTIALLISVIVIVLNIYLLYTTFAGGDCFADI